MTNAPKATASDNPAWQAAAWHAPSQRRAPRIVRAAEPNARLHVECRCGEWTSCGALDPLPAACPACGQPLKPSLGARLLALRRLRGLVQKEVAARLHVHDSVFALWEAGKRNVPVRWIETLAAVLEVPISLLAHDAKLSMALFDGEEGATPVEVEPAGESQPRVELVVRDQPSGGGPAVSMDPGGRRAVYTFEVSCLSCGRADLGKAAVTSCGGLSAVWRPAATSHCVASAALRRLWRQHVVG